MEHSFAARGGLPAKPGRGRGEEERVHRRTGHILVVDDDALNRRLLTATLAKEGIRTTSATDGAQALDAIREDPPDVVLLDIEMPGIDGFEVLERIKGDEAVRHLPVIMISGLGDTESVVRCLEIGADDFLPKPFDAAILRARVNAGLDKKALHDLERERVRDIFTRFLPEQMVDEVLARTDGDARIHPELLTGTVLFGDLRGFTRFAEGRPVGEVIEAINTYLTLMTDAVLDLGGTLVDYMGDGIMAAFGAPVASDDHADLALAAARAMAGEQLATFNAWLSATAGVQEPIRMGIGVNSGPVVSGSVGSPRRLDYAVIGDTTNTASRIEAMTKELDRAVLFSEQTKDALHELPEDAVSLGEFEIRGRSAGIKLWALDVEEPP
jgi:adenylate cyclase